MERGKQGRALLAVGVAALLLAVDQATKYFVLEGLKPLGAVTVIPGLLEFSYVENRAAAMGLFGGLIWLVAAVTVATCGAILVLLFRYKDHSFFSYCSGTLLLAGGIGNLVDRIHLGYVVDFIHVLFFPYVFNFADCCVTVGAVCLVAHYLLLSRREQAEVPEEEGGTWKEG